MKTSSSDPLTWAFAIPTYNRQAVLIEAVRNALRQTLPPVEIVISDSSPDREDTAEKLEALLKEEGKGVRLVCIRAAMANKSCQLNEVIKECHADILFLFDDDTFIAPDGAEKILSYFERDDQRELVGLCPGDLSLDEACKLFNVPDGVTGGSAATNYGANKLAIWWLNLFPGSLKPARPNPAQFADLPSIFFVEGYKLVVRREAAQAALFDQNIVINYGEEADFCYRITREGAIVEIPDRVVFHMAAPRVGGTTREGPVYRFGCQVISAYRCRKYFGDGLWIRFFPFWNWFRYLTWDALSVLRGKGTGRFVGTLRSFPTLTKLAFTSQASVGKVTESACFWAREHLKK